MKKIIAVLIVAGVLAGAGGYAYASDWDKAGKALTIIEGIRILTRGSVDVIGTVTGINNREPRYAGHRDEHRYRSRGPEAEYCPRRVWVPHYVWVKRYVPERVEYSRRYGRVIVPGHYVEYQVEEGGHWEYRDGRGR